MGSAHFTPFNFRINYININTSSSLIIPKWSEKYLQIVSGFATHQKKEKKKKKKGNAFARYSRATGIDSTT
jgi:hypothetical protein